MGDRIDTALMVALVAALNGRSVVLICPTEERAREVMAEARVRLGSLFDAVEAEGPGRG